MHKSTRKRLVLHSEKIRVMVLHRGSILGGNLDPGPPQLGLEGETPTSHKGICTTPASPDA